MIIYGKQVVLYAIQKNPKIIQELYVAKELEKALFNQLVKVGVKIIRVDSKKAQALARGGNHQGILAKIAPLRAGEKKELFAMKKLVVLCGISDVGNIGSIVRSAYALGVEGMVFCGELSEKAMEGVIRSSAGAMLDFFFFCTPHCLELIHELKEAKFVCYGADMGGEEVSRIKNNEKWALFLGSEGEGLGKKIIQKMDKIISIEMKNNFDSLNVGVAAGILMHRLVR